MLTVVGLPRYLVSEGMGTSLTTIFCEKLYKFSLGVGQINPTPVS
jgi:hypothetical protein